MRLITPTTIALAALLFSSVPGVANAAGTEKDSGKGAAGPTAGGGDSPGGGKTSDLADTRDRATDTAVADKTWAVGAGLEFHHTGLDSGYINNGSARNVDYWSVFGRWDPSPYDRVAVRFGVYQGFLSDMGESGVRADDISLSYTRRIPLPGEVTMRISASVTLPVSYGSQLAGLYTAPKLSLSADRKFGRYFSLDGRVTGGVFIAKYAEGGAAYQDGGLSGFGATGLGSNGGGSNPNPKASLSLALTADLAMPFHTPLSVGLSLYTGYSWLDNVCGSAGSAGQSMSAFGMAPAASVACNNPTVAQGGQPFQQAYAGELYAHYTLPTLGGFASDLGFAFAPNGDPTLGYASVLHGTGLPQVYPFYNRETAEVYASISGRY